MTQLGRNLEELRTLFKHLQNKSFKTLISWKGSSCEARHLEIFESVVLATWNRGLSLSEFVSRCKTLGIEAHIESQKILINFPKHPDLQRLERKKPSLVFRRLQFMEDKQRKLQEMISRVQGKLEKAIQINKQIKSELTLSKDLQMDKISQLSIQA
jgi:hypothetical protein